MTIRKSIFYMIATTILNVAGDAQLRPVPCQQGDRR
jgi:hypothetical protein